MVQQLSFVLVCYLIVDLIGEDFLCFVPIGFLFVKTFCQYELLFV